MAFIPQNRRRAGNPFGNWVGIIMMVVILIGLFVLLRGIFKLLYFLAPVMLIVTLILDYKVVINYIKQLGSLFARNPLYGVGATALTFFFYPIVFAILLFRAFAGRQRKRFIGESEARTETDFVEYEEIDDEPLDLDEFGKVKEKRYDDYFKGDESR
ncbi:hypothetical protein [Portibacter marinus]|uniref:hypothetical protein n=1 Tax=Portibacter marinus TaxID=2898660 RepID=UPI001F42E42A|nr:hypothetical protein [Portibacter marinus]